MKRYLVVGLGSTGISVLRYLSSIGASAVGYDAQLSPKRAEQLQNEFTAFSFTSADLAQTLQHCDIAILSPGVSRRLPEIVAFEASGGTVTGDVAILSDLLRDTSTKIIAITGSNGKTTTTSLVSHLCQKMGLDTVTAGNIGTPVLQAWLDRAGKPANVWILELSSFQLETTPHLAATAATCLNISEDHLDRYRDLLDYAYNKDEIFNGAKVQILNADDPLCHAMSRPESVTHYFSLHKACDFWFDGLQLMHNHTSIMAQTELLLQGTHNIANVLAALALCEGIGLKSSQLIPHICSFKGLAHRVELVREKNGIRFIDDSKGTNVGATLAAINGLDGPMSLILGGLGKGQDFTPLRHALSNKVVSIQLIGQDAPKIAQDLANCGIPMHFQPDMPSAVQHAYLDTPKGGIVLLSPACASMDMFKNYAHRSQVFIESIDCL